MYSSHKTIYFRLLFCFLIDETWYKSIYHVSQYIAIKLTITAVYPVQKSSKSDYYNIEKKIICFFFV